LVLAYDPCIDPSRRFASAGAKLRDESGIYALRKFLFWHVRDLVVKTIPHMRNVFIALTWEADNVSKVRQT
jgi:hypothetical protein